MNHAENWLSGRLKNDLNSGLPKYLQLRKAISDAIADDSLAESARLPAEEILVKMSGFSLGTVQRALSALVDDGLLTRRQGSGTFVAGREAPMKAPFYHCKFIDEQTGDILPIYSHILGRKRVSSEGAWGAHLSGDEHVCIERIFAINNEFDVYTLAYIEVGMFPLLEEVPLDQLNGVNLKEILEREYRRPATRFTEKLAVSTFSPAICKAMKIPKGSSGAVLEISAFDRRGEAVYFQSLFIPPSDRKLVLG
jgi:DNA-binding GntR family transcriptional regulator